MEGSASRKSGWSVTRPSPTSRPNYRSRSLIALVLVMAVLVRFAIAATLPLVEPSEGRYAQISQEMAASGDWVTPHLWLDGERVPFLGKPPLFFWSAALSIRLFGANELAVRLPSLILAATLLILMYEIVGYYLGRRIALNATVIAVSSPLFFAASGTVILDLHLTFFVVGALLAYLAFALETDLRTQKRWSLAIFVFLAGGFLTKGPVAIVLFGLPVLLWTILLHKWRLVGRHSWAAGMTLFVLLVVPWFVLAELRNPGFLRYFFVNENLLRYISPEYGDLYGTGHRFPRGTAALMFLAASLPWTPMTICFVIKHRRSRIRQAIADEVSLLLFLGFASNVVFWCFARQLLATYLLPTIPLFAIWAAHMLGPANGRTPQLARLAATAAATWALLFFAVSPAVSRDSTRGVLAEAAEISRLNHTSGTVVFAGRTPYSARFYNSRVVGDHPTEQPSKTIFDSIEAGDSRLLILRDSDIDSVPEELRDHLRPTASNGCWWILTPATGGRRPAEASSEKH